MRKIACVVLIICVLLLLSISISATSPYYISMNETEYRDYLNTYGTPYHFITYDQISVLGAFSSFSSNHEGGHYGGYYSDFRYEIIDDNGYKFELGFLQYDN